MAPVQRSVPFPYKLSRVESRAIDREVAKLTSRGVLDNLYMRMANGFLMCLSDLNQAGNSG